MDWLIEYTRQKILEAWNDVEKYAPMIWVSITNIVDSVIKLIRK